MTNLLPLTSVSAVGFIILPGLNLTIQTLDYLFWAGIVPIPPHTQDISSNRMEEL